MRRVKGPLVVKDLLDRRERSPRRSPRCWPGPSERPPCGKSGSVAAFPHKVPDTDPSMHLVPRGHWEHGAPILYISDQTRLPSNGVVADEQLVLLSVVLRVVEHLAASDLGGVSPSELGVMADQHALGHEEGFEERSIEVLDLLVPTLDGDLPTSSRVSELYKFCPTDRNRDSCRHSGQSWSITH